MLKTFNEEILQAALVIKSPNHLPTTYTKDDLSEKKEIYLSKRVPSIHKVNNQVVKSCDLCLWPKGNRGKTNLNVMKHMNVNKSI